MDVPEVRHDPVDNSAEGPDRRREQSDTDSNMMTEIGVANERFDRCWEQILKHTPRLDDLFALFETSSYLRSTVEIFVGTGDPQLTIDGDCLKRYPLEEQEYNHLYQRIGPVVHNLTVYKVSEQQLEGLSGIFINIQNLHLERVILGRNTQIKFPNLLGLKLTECVIHVVTFDDIFSAVNSPLNFHLNKSTIVPGYPIIPWNNNGMVIPKHLLPQTEVTQSNDTQYASVFLHNLKCSQLTLERVSCVHLNMDCSAINSLRIVDCDESTTMPNIEGKESYKNLKYLSLETKAAVLDFVANASKLKLDSLEMLTLSHLPTPLNWLGGLKKLQQLSLLRPIQNYQQVDLIEALSAMEMEIDVKYSCVYSVPAVDLIINVLNEDCLREIFSYLSFDDLFNLAMINSQFKELIASIDASTMGISVEIDEEFLSRHPLKQQLTGYEVLGHSLTKISLWCSVEEFTALAPCFPILRKLNLASEFKWTDQLIEIFPSVDELDLNLSFENIPKDILMKLFHKLKPTLRKLYVRCECDDLEFIQYLNDLEELAITGTVLNEDLHEFWKHNPRLKVLDISNPSDNDPPLNFPNQQRNWQEIANLKNLSDLRLERNYNSVFPELLSKITQVKELVLWDFDVNLSKDFLSSIGSQLEILTVMDSNLIPEEIFATISRFKNLRSFEFVQGDDTVPLSVSEVIRLMVDLPMLSLIKFDWAPISFYHDLEDLQIFLTTEDRVLYFNGVKYPQ